MTTTTIFGNELKRHSTHLTDRERSLMIALGQTAGTDKQVAAALNLGVGTVKVYLTRIRVKLIGQGYDVKSRYNLITWAREHKAELEAE